MFREISDGARDHLLCTSEENSFSLDTSQNAMLYGRTSSTCCSLLKLNLQGWGYYCDITLYSEFMYKNSKKLSEELPFYFLFFGLKFEKTSWTSAFFGVYHLYWHIKKQMCYSSKIQNLLWRNSSSLHTFSILCHLQRLSLLRFSFQTTMKNQILRNLSWN